MKSLDRREVHAVLLSTALVSALAVSASVAVKLQVVPTLIVPVLIAGIPLLAQSGRFARATDLGAAAVMAVWVTIASFSVGMYYVPAALLLLLAGLAAPGGQAGTAIGS